MQIPEVGLGFLVSTQSCIMEREKVCQTELQINKVMLSQHDIQSESRRLERGWKKEAVSK